LALIGTVAAVELALRLPIGGTVAQMHTTVGKITRVIGSKHISDHWKERILPSYALRLMQVSLLIPLLLALALAPFAVIALFSPSVDPSFADYLISWQGIAVSSLCGLGYFYVRSRLRG
jgi:hypothetical protein